MRILVVSHSPHLPTGNGRVVRELARFLDDVVFAGYGYYPGAPLPPHISPQQVMPCERFSPDGVIAAIQCFRPDWVLLLGDTWDFPYITTIFPYCSYIAGWLTVCCECLPERELVQLQYLSAVMCPSMYGVRTLASHGLQAEYVPEGVSEDFVPLVHPPQAYLLWVGVNMSRKNPYLMLEIVKQTGMPAIMKVDSLFSRSGADLIVYAEHLGIDYDVDKFESQLTFAVKEWTQEQLVAIYQGASHYIHTSGNEGFGLPIIEARACGVPTIGIRYTSIGELVDLAIEPTGFVSSLPHCRIASAPAEAFVSAIEQVKPSPLPAFFSWPQIAKRIQNILASSPGYSHWQETLITRRV